MRVLVQFHMKASELLLCSINMRAVVRANCHDRSFYWPRYLLTKKMCFLKCPDILTPALRDILIYWLFSTFSICVWLILLFKSALFLIYGGNGSKVCVALLVSYILVLIFQQPCNTDMEQGWNRQIHHNSDITLQHNSIIVT